MKIVLTGATGYLGSRFVRALIRDGHDIVIVKRSFSNTSRIDDLLPYTAIHDLDHSPLDDLFRKNGTIDTVIHTATNYGRKNERFSETFEANTGFPIRLLEAAIRYKVDAFINTDTTLDKFVNPYSISKKQFMEWGRHLAGQNNTRFINIRLEHMYGDGDDPSKFTTHVIQSCRNNVPELKLTEGVQKRDFVYIEDVISAYRIILKNHFKMPDAYLEYELGSGEAVSIREFVETVHRLTDSRTTLRFGAVPFRDNETMFSQAKLDALKHLGWSPGFSLEEGLRETLREETMR